MQHARGCRPRCEEVRHKTRTGHLRSRSCQAVPDQSRRETAKQRSRQQEAAPSLLGGKVDAEAEAAEAASLAQQRLLRSRSESWLFLDKETGHGTLKVYGGEAEALSLLFPHCSRVPVQQSTFRRSSRAPAESDWQAKVAPR